MKLYEFIHKLFEATPQQIYKTYNDDIVAKAGVADGKPIVDALAKIAPTNAVNTYMLTLYRAWMDGLIDVNADNKRLHKALTAFEKLRKNKKTTHSSPDLYKFNDLKAEALAAWKQEEEEKRREEERQAQRQAVTDSGEIKTIYEDSEIKLLHPTSFEACRLFGREGSWCVSTKQGYWDDYSAEGDFYILFIKRNPAKGIKKQKQFGIHLRNREWQNEQNQKLPDSQIRKLVDTFPKIKQLLRDEAIKHDFKPLLDVNDWYKREPYNFANYVNSEFSDASDEEIAEWKNMIEPMDDQWKTEFIDRLSRSGNAELTLPMFGFDDWYKTRPRRLSFGVYSNFSDASDEQINKWKNMIQPMDEKWKDQFIDSIIGLMDHGNASQMLAVVGLSGWYKTRPTALAYAVATEFSNSSDEEIAEWKNMIKPMSDEWKKTFVQEVIDSMNDDWARYVLLTLGIDDWYKYAPMEVVMMAHKVLHSGSSKDIDEFAQIFDPMDNEWKNKFIQFISLASPTGSAGEILSKLGLA